MSGVALTLGRLDAPGYEVRRSGLRWLRRDGQRCVPGDLLAYCNVALVRDAMRPFAAQPFADEIRDLQVALVARVGGRLRHAPGSSLGGQLDYLPEQELWDPEREVGRIESGPDGPPFDAVRESPLDLLFGAGRRVAEIAEERSGFLTGWHDRARAWWGAGAGASSLMGLGICEQDGVFRGDRQAFRNWFDAAGGPVEVIHVPDHVLVPCSAVVAEQMRRTPEQAAAIRADAWRSLANGPEALDASDWVFVGALLSALLRSPLTERRDLIAREGLRKAGTPDAVLLSLNAEAPKILRHRRLGYAIAVHGYRLDEARAVRRWLERDFEAVPRTTDDIAHDLGALADAFREHGGSAVLVMNTVSSSGYEEIASYAAFDRPLGATLASVRAKDMNLMLHDLARERDLAIVDNDALAASMGAIHLSGGTHSSGAMQAELRADILRILRERGIPGFAPRAAR